MNISEVKLKGYCLLNIASVLISWTGVISFKLDVKSTIFVINFHDKKPVKSLLATILLFVLYAATAFSQSKAQPKCMINVKVDKPIAAIQPTMWGIFFEDINMGADGGIYAELVKNRSFEFYKPLAGWTVQPADIPYVPFQKQFGEGTVMIVNRQEKNEANPRFIRITASNASKGGLGLSNEGFDGMGVRKDVQYNFSFMYHQQAAGLKLYVELVDSTGKNLGGTSLIPSQRSNEWHKQSASFVATATESKARMNIWFEGTGIIDLDMISLFPADTWKNRPGGMRADLVQLLADLKPGFIRFPGGCIVEGRELSTRYQWKKTLGPVEERKLIVNRWNTEIVNRPAPDYFQTFGLGFFEYFQLAEDIGAEPLPILNCGMACQFNTAEVAPVEELDPYIQDALDLVEFANGNTNTKWGAVRAGLGHPAPFHLKMIGVGNENWGPQYVERLKLFQKAIKEKYPAIKIIASSGAMYEGKMFDYLTTELKKIKPEFIDEHYYNRPEWFLKNASRYDDYDRSGSKIFAGEYAAQSDRVVSTDNKNNLQTAIAEAAFLTGLERNADVVNMAAYAPLFARVDGWQWKPDLIWFDNLHAYGTPNYYVQKLFSNNKGTDLISALSNGKPLTGQDSLYASAVIDKKTGELIVKIVNSSSIEKQTCIEVEGTKKIKSPASAIILTGQSLDQENSIESPVAIAPLSQSTEVTGKKINITIKPNSLTVIRAGMYQ
jgi:alpha-L-arabinofuranosidase